MSGDAAVLRRRLARARQRRADAGEWTRLEEAIGRAVERCATRAARRPAIAYPADLPVAQHAREIGDAIRAHPVVIVAGATGSGKTTQLPKICLDIGRGERALIGHTQPRRIAARAVATRIAEELGTELGDLVGYKVRFTDQTKPDAYVKLMTDGILLAETQGDRLLAAYDTIIVDEAHERSLNIDFLLGYLHRLLAQRPDLKIVITSATLDAERFARHFARDIDGVRVPAPVIEVSGRLYPVEVRYRPLASDEEGDDEEEMEDAIVAAAEDLWRERAGDMLVFLPGEREIRETQELLRRSLARRPYARDIEILPLFARLTPAEQQRVFGRSTGRRIVLATNVAETSLTVPGIRYVIDSGLARVKRYSVRNKTTLLQIEKISQAAANQRAGRCGRVAEGICVRLYAEEDFAARPAYTEPEILRSSLATVILRMAALDLGDVAAFPFVEAPLPRAIADGYQLLQELGAVDEGRALTKLGRELARLPLDARIGRMIIEARERGCLAEVLVIASALSVPDPRERPLDKRQAADEAHLRFRDERSDFLSLILLWEFFAAELARKTSHRALVDACRAQFVSWLRLREWRDVHAQLVAEIREQGWNVSADLPAAFDAARYQLVHQALLAGLLSNIGQRSEAPAPASGDARRAAGRGDSDGYEGVRGLHFYLHPGSGIAKKPPKWVLAAELVQTARLFARCAARIEPEWIEAVAGDRVTRDYFEPRWDEARGEVIASERVQLYGLTIVPRRRVSYGRIDPVAARDVFIREALVPATLATRGAFMAHNRRVIAEARALEDKARRQDVLIDEEGMAAWYAARVPADIYSLAGLEKWRSEAERDNARLLFFAPEDVMRHDAAHVTAAWFPDTLALAGAKLPLRYRFSPGHPLDGLTLTVPLPLLNQIDAARLTWLVPGMVREKISLYLKALPKAWRNRLVPLPDSVTAFLESEPSQDIALPNALRAFIGTRLRDLPPSDVWDDVELPPHLVMNVRVIDDAGRELAEGRDLAALRAKLGEAAALSFAETGPAIERKGLTRWDFGDLPETITRRKGQQRLTGYPALIDEGTSVAITLLDTPEAAQDATRRGVLRLMRIALTDVLARYTKGPAGFAAAAIAFKPAIGADALLADVLDAVIDRAFIGEDALPRSEQAFAEQIKRARTRLPAVAESAFRLLATIGTRYQALNQRLASVGARAGPIGPEVRARRDALVHAGFFSATPWPRLNDIPRYLEALERRVAKYVENPARDARHAGNVAAWWQRYRERLEANRAAGRREEGLAAFRWLLEELSVSLFAQELKTPFPVSYKRVEKAWADLQR